MTHSTVLTLVVGVLVIPVALLLWLWLGERIVKLLPARAQEGTRAGFWLVFPVILGGGILLYPLVQTVVMSFQDSRGEGFVGFANFAWVLGPDVVPVLINNVLWLVVLPIITLVGGLVLAAMADRVKYEWLIRTIAILPMAISFVAASVIWRLMYAYQPSGANQLGTLNAILNALGLDTVAFLSDPALATFALIGVGVWMSVGLSMLMLSAAIKNVDASTLEAARLDGAGEISSFFHITVPQIGPTLAVVYTTQVIFALKVFDIVYAMTNGAFNTDVIANRMYSELYRTGEYGHAAAIAVVLLVAAVPVIVFNLRQFRAERG
jgi:alpha-glucoside transport system permease protein